MHTRAPHLKNVRRARSTPQEPTTLTRLKNYWAVLALTFARKNSKSSYRTAFVWGMKRGVLFVSTTHSALSFSPSLSRPLSIFLSHSQALSSFSLPHNVFFVFSYCTASLIFIEAQHSALKPTCPAWQSTPQLFKAQHPQRSTKLSHMSLSLCARLYMLRCGNNQDQHFETFIRLACLGHLVHGLAKDISSIPPLHCFGLQLAPHNHDSASSSRASLPCRIRRVVQ